MAERSTTYDGVEILEDWKSSMPFFPTLRQRQNSIQMIQEQYLQEGQLNIFPSSFKPMNDTIESVKTCLRKTFKEGLVLASTSLIPLMDIEAPAGRPPEEIQCEVLIIVPDEPAMIFCVLEQPSSVMDKHQKHLKHLAQQIMYTVRLFSDEHFSVLHGLVSKVDFTSDETLKKTLRGLYEKRSKFCHPEALSMGNRKFRSIGLAVLASIAVTDIPWQLSTESAGNRRASDEKELWFLTKEQFIILSETVDVSGQRNTFALDLKEPGCEVEVNIDGNSFMVLELAKRWNKLKPTLACTKVLQHFRGKISKAPVLPEITNTVELQAGQAHIENISYVVAEDISGEDVGKLLAGQHHIEKCIVFNANEPNSPISATEEITNWMEQDNLAKITFLERSDAEINQDSDTFVETSPFKKALDLLLDRKCLVITGASGEGKSSIARALCRHFRDSQTLQYTPLYIRHLDDFQKFADAKERKILVLEDMFGVINVSIPKLFEWEKMLPKLEDVVKGSDSLLVVTCKSGFEEKALPVLDRLPHFNRDCIFDISQSLTFEDKMELIKTYGYSFVNIHNPLWETLVLEDDIGFPLSCRFILKQKLAIEVIIRGFRRPIEFLRKDLHELISKDALHCAFFVMLVSCGGSVDSSNEAQTKKWNLILQRFQFDFYMCQEQNFKVVRKEMPKCYIQAHPLNPNKTSFTHQAVFFASLQCIAMENIDLLFEFAVPSVASKFFVLETQNVNIGYKMIMIPILKQKDLLRKFVNIFEQEQNGSMFLNASFMDVSFVQKFISELKNSFELLVGTVEAHVLTPLQLIVFSKNNKLFTQVINSNILAKLSGNDCTDLLLACCKSGNDLALNTLLQSCHDLSMQNLILCLEGAIQWFHPEMVRFMLRHRVSRFKVRKSDLIKNLLKENKISILASVLEAVDKETVDTLSEVKFWCSQHNGHCTIATCFAERHDLTNLRHFCKIRVNMNACNGRNETPLHVACRNKDEPLVEFLITHGVNLEVRTNDGKTPLDYVCEYRSLPMLRTLLLMLVKGLKTTKRPNGTYFSFQEFERGNFAQATSLHLACILGHVNAVQCLITSGEDINSKDKFGQTPLHLAIENGNNNIVDLLLQKQANISSSDLNGRTPLFIACNLQDISTAKKLIRFGCHVNQGNESGITPLHIAADLEQVSLVELLLQSDADVDQQTTEGITPLHLACKRSNYQIVKLLLDKGANVAIEDIRGQSPLNLAERVGDKSIINTILRRKAFTPAGVINKSQKYCGKSLVKREKKDTCN